MKVLEKKDGKSTRFLLSWRGLLFPFGTIEFKRDGSLMFSSAFHNTPEKYPIITTGEFHREGNLLIDPSGGKPKKIESYNHVSLHPRNQTVHFTTNTGFKFLETKKNWFPVKEHFRLLNFISPPMDLSKSVDKSGIKITVPDDYTDSIEMLIDIHPRDIAEYSQIVPALSYVEGFCPDYLLICTFVKSNQRVAPVIYWPA
jgi:hypothetical protein